MFMLGYDYVNMNIFVTSQVTNAILEPFCRDCRGLAIRHAAGGTCIQ